MIYALQIQETTFDRLIAQKLKYKQSPDYDYNRDYTDERLLKKKVTSQKG